MRYYEIVITVDLEDDDEADRVLEEVKERLTPLPVPDRDWHFAILSPEKRARIPRAHPGH